MIIYLENISGEVKQLHIHEFAIDEILEIDHTWYIDAVIEAVSAGDFRVRNQDGIITGTAKQLDWLQGIDRSIVVANEKLMVTPEAPVHDYGLRPYGLVHKHLDASGNIFDITLSNKNGNNIDYSNCSVTPASYDCIKQDHSAVRDGVYSVNGNTLTMFMGQLQNGAATLVKPIYIDYLIAAMEEVNSLDFWGMFFSAENFGEDDVIRIQELDGDGNLLKEFDDCWVSHLNGIKFLATPKGAPWEMSVGNTIRLSYYPSDIEKTNIKVWADYWLTVRD